MSVLEGSIAKIIQMKEKSLSYLGLELSFRVSKFKFYFRICCVIWRKKIIVLTSAFFKYLCKYIFRYMQLNVSTCANYNFFTNSLQHFDMIPDMSKLQSTIFFSLDIFLMLCWVLCEFPEIFVIIVEKLETLLQLWQHISLFRNKGCILGKMFQ